MNMLPTTASTSFASRLSAPERHVHHAWLLFGAGVLLAGFHRAFDLSLGLPGHFGIVWMAVMVLARAGAQQPWAASLTAAGYVAGGAMLTGAGAHGGLNVPGYLACAALLDLAWWFAPALLTRPTCALFTGAAVFACKPLLLAVVVVVTDMHAGSLRHGFGWVFLTHAVFGGVGAALGAVLWSLQAPAPRASRRH